MTEKSRHYWHPQVSSLRSATMAAQKFGMKDKVVLDCFCGSGTLLIAALKAGASQAIGSDLDNWEAALRKQIAPEIRLFWRVDALEAIRQFHHDILFIDPPNPIRLDGGSSGAGYSILRETGMSLSTIVKELRPKLNPKNLMGKRSAVTYTMKVILEELKAEKRVLVNAFQVERGRRLFSYHKALGELFTLEPVGVAKWCEVE